MKRSHSSPLSFLFPWLSPLVISFAIVDGGIEVQLSQNNQLLKDWQPSRLRRILPEPLIKWMEDQRIHIGPQPYPLIKQLIKQLWQSLAPRTSKKLIFDPASLAELREGPQPQDFALVWKLNRSSERIEGHYEGADRYLGMGWFQKGTSIWSLSNTPSVELDIYLKDLTYPVRHVAVLFESNIPYLQRYLPTRADFKIITDFAPKVIASDISNNAITFALQSNYPQLLPTIKLPQQKIDVLLADHAIIQFSQQALTPVMTALLESGSAITLEGDSIPFFIRDQMPIMKQQQHISDAFVESISQAYPIVPIPTLKPTFSLAHTLENGVGVYRVTAIYRYAEYVLDIDALLSAHQRSQRFIRQHGIWFEWPENSRAFVNTILQQRATQLLRPEEIMGFDTRRLDLFPNESIASPIQPVGITLTERGQSILKQLRRRGIPGGFIGEPPGLVSMFVKACEDLIHDNRQASILWVVPSQRKGSVTRAVNASVVNSSITVASSVTLRDEPALISRSWTLVIFQALDQLLDTTHSSATLKFPQFKYVWALVSLARTSPVTLSEQELRQLIMSELHLPEKYYEQFCSLYLLDPLKSSSSVQTSNSSGTLNNVQTGSQKHEVRAAYLPSSSSSHVAKPIIQTQKEPKVVAHTTSKVPSKESTFLAQAMQYVGKTHIIVPLVRFKCHVPSYNDMDARQLEWYFYWRNEVRNGRYPITELSYILVHVYETLACVGFADAMQAYERLVALWRQYSRGFPLLDQYLIPWIADFCVVYTLPQTPMQWYTRLLTVPDCAVDVPLMAEAWWRQGGKWAEIPPAVLYKLVGFDAPQKLSLNTQQKKALDDAYRLAIAEVDQYLRPQYGLNALVKHYSRKQVHSVGRRVFQGSLVEQLYPRMTIATINAVFDDVEFCRAILGILKYADYIQRKLYQNKTERFVPTIDMSWQKVIETALRGQPLSQAEHTAEQTQRLPSTVSSQSLQAKVSQQANQDEDKQQPEKLPSVKQSPAQRVSPSSVAPATGASHVTGGNDSDASQSVESKPASVSKRRSIELDQHTIVRLQHESEQLRERLTVEDEEDPRPSLSVTQQNGDPFGEVRDVSKVEAKPVPEKVVPHEEVAVRPDVNQDQKKEPALSTTRTEALSFWDQARQWKDRSYGPVPLEKFKHYHPDYTLMNTSQLNWYFYWRSEVRSGRYPTTDVGYIFIHAYEALGCIGFTNPAQACDRLFSLWKHYRESFADLDKYLIPWIADFCVVHTVPLTPMQWYTQVLALSDSDIDAQLVAEAWLHQGGDWMQIPPAVLYKLAGFNIQTKFYQKMRQKHALDDGYKRAIAAVDNYLSSKFDRPALIAQYGKGKLQAVEREPFKWALVEKPYAPITVAHINAAFTETGFLQALSGILKYADHVQRKLYQNAVSPFAPTIDINWQEAIDVVLTNKLVDQSKEAQGKTVSSNTLPAMSPELQRKDTFVKPVVQKTSATLNPAVQLNPEAISRLRAESDQLQGRLTIEKEEDREEQSPQIISIPEVVPVVTPTIRNISVSESEVDEEWKGIVQQWGSEHWEVIRLLHQGKQTELVSVERQVRRPLSRLIDEVNSPVDEVLGDLLIDPDTRMIANHLQEAIEMLLGWYLASREK